MWRVGRIATGCACMICAAWGAFSYEGGEIPFEPTITFIGLFIVWAFAESKDTAAPEAPNDTLHPHDVALGEKIRTIFNESNKRYLREYSFGNSFEYARLDFAREVREWQGPEYEFEDATLDNLASELVRKATELCDKISEDAGPLGFRDDFWTFVPHQERISDWHSAETTLKIREVDKIADEIAALADNFEKAFRKLSPESYLRIQQA